MRIQYNSTAMNAVRNFGTINNKQVLLSEKLASGYHINRAADNAAGLKISEKMRGQIRGLQQGSRNAQDGISFLQTADGTLNEVHSILQRTRELSVQAANDTNVTADRESIQEELEQLMKELDRITGESEFNTKKIFDGSLQGSSSGTTSPFRVIDNTNIRIYNLNSEFTATQSAKGGAAVNGFNAIANILDREIVPQAVNALLNTYSGAFGYLRDCSTGIGLEIKDDPLSGALASVSIGGENGRLLKDGSLTYDLTYKLTVNVAYLDLNADGTLKESSRQNLEGTILHEMTHAFMDETMTKGMLLRDDAYPLWLVEGMAQTAVGGYADFNDWMKNGLGITESSTESAISSIVRNGNNRLGLNTGNASYGTGYLACMYLGQLASGTGVSSSSITPVNIRGGLDKVLIMLGKGSSLDTVIKEVTGGRYTSTSDFQNKFGDSESALFIKELTKKVGSGNGSLVGGDFSKTDLLPNKEASSTVFDLNPNTETVVNRYPDDVMVLSGGGKSGEGKAPTPTYGTGGTGGVTPPDLGNKDINISTLKVGSGNGYTFDGSTLHITGNGDYNLTGRRSGISIVIDDGVEANLNVTDLDLNATSSAGITIGENATVTMNVTGNNKISSQTGAGISVASTATLNIKGDGTLTVNAKTGSGAAAIGGEKGKGTGTIQIECSAGKGLVIDANGDNGKSAIGSGMGSSIENVKIISGIVMDGADGSGTVYGKVNVTNKVDTKGGVLTVDSGATLTVSSTGSIVDGGSEAKIINKGKIENRGSIGSHVSSVGGEVKTYIGRITHRKPSEVSAGMKLTTDLTTNATLSYNGGKSETINGTWTVRDSSGNIIDALNTEAEESQNYTFTVTYQLTDGQFASGLRFASDTTLTSNLIHHDNLLVGAYNEKDATINHAVNVNSLVVGDGGRTLTVSYNMKPRKAPGTGGSGGVGTVDGMMLQIGANTGQGMSITIDKISTEELGLKDLSVMNYVDANDAIDKCDKAISKVSSVRSRIGAYQNRLEHAINNLDNIAENLESAESRIRDQDMASGMVEFSKNQIILQAAQAMITQANQAPNGILQLLH